MIGKKSNKAIAYTCHDKKRRSQSRYDKMAPLCHPARFAQGLYFGQPVRLSRFSDRMKKI